MKAAETIITALYRHPRLFDIKSFEADLERRLRAFFKENNQSGFAAFTKKLQDRELLSIVLDALSAIDLRKILKEIDAAWPYSKASVAAMRDRIIAIADGDAKPASDLPLRAKKHVAALKASKTLEALRSVYTSIGDIELSREAIKLLPSKMAFARRFDKSYPDLAKLSDEQLAQLLIELASAKRQPSPKKLGSASAKAKWDGKEPD